MEAVTPERPGRGGCPALQVSHKMVNHGYTPKLRALAQRDTCSNITTNDEYETFCFPPVLSIFMNLFNFSGSQVDVKERLWRLPTCMP